MKGRNLKKKKPSAQQSKGKNNSTKRIAHDPFFDATEQKRRRKFDGDEDIESSDEDGGEFDSEGEREEGEKDEEIEETPAEKKKRLADEFLRAIREKERKKEEDESEEDDEVRREREGERDSLIAKILQQEQLEESGRVRRGIASRVQKPETSEGFRFRVNHRQPVTSVVLSEDDCRGFSASKDGGIVHWDVDGGKSEKYTWPSEEVLKSHGVKDPQGRATRHSKHVLALAVSSDGRYLASGGLDRYVHLWDIRTRKHIQSEVLTIDSLRKERVLTVGRDRTMRLWKLMNFSSFAVAKIGSDDGSIEHWNVLRKKPVHRVKNAHASLSDHKFEQANCEGLSNGHLENDAQGSSGFGMTALSWVNSVAVCRSSDLAASGAGNGCVRLWAIETESKGLRPLFELSLVGFVNSLAFAKSGKFLIAGVGQEPRLGRWGRVAAAKNGVALHPLELS
ncbi:UNVERIFIED_CONTAM: U3 snoRNP-associated protein-like [Sesamum calycinum]|uniref:U3 snoRNP-associated protein-like n=1 Tax=Sesamum calycinum TaxID=2727403 RepID=A0AAW2J7K6_9LAMI